MQTKFLKMSLFLTCGLIYGAANASDNEASETENSSNSLINHEKNVDNNMKELKKKRGSQTEVISILVQAEN